MTVPPDEGRPPASPGAPDPEPPLDFDPYRFGKPDHPVAPEYAPPGYRPPAGLTPPQFNYPPPPPRSAPYGAPRPGNTKATIALVLGIVAIVLSFLSLWDLLLAVPAIVLGATARSDAKRYPERGGLGSATAGLICGIVAVALAVVATVYIVVKIRPCVDEFGSSGKEFQTCATDRLVGD